MDTHLYTKQYNLAFLGSKRSFIMKDLVEKFIVLQIQTAPSRLQHASARCFLVAMILPSAPSRIRAHAQHTTLSRLYTTIENPSYFFMTLSCTEAIQSFISHFNQYSLVDPSWSNIPSWVWQGVNHWFRKLRRRVWHHRHFGNWISWK